MGQCMQESALNSAIDCCVRQFFYLFCEILFLIGKNHLTILCYGSVRLKMFIIAFIMDSL